MAMDETELSARGDPGGEAGGAAPGPTPGEVTTDEGASIAAEFEAGSAAFEEGFVLGGGEGDVVERAVGDEPFEPAVEHPDGAVLAPDDLQMVDAQPDSDPHEHDVLPSEGEVDEVVTGVGTDPEEPSVDPEDAEEVETALTDQPQGGGS
jgi:hypothetical protein